MTYFKLWINPHIPIEYLVCSLIVLCFIILVGFLCIEGHNLKKFVFGAIGLEYYFLILCSTVIRRTVNAASDIQLIPFYKYPDIWNKVDHPNDLMEVLLNVALFISIGLLLGGILEKRKWWKVAAIGFGLSLFIETLQLITHRGWFETDDLIHNTLGCLIGYGIFKVFRKTIGTR